MPNTLIKTAIKISYQEHLIAWRPSSQVATKLPRVSPIILFRLFTARSLAANVNVWYYYLIRIVSLRIRCLGEQEKLKPSCHKRQAEKSPTERRRLKASPIFANDATTRLFIATVFPQFRWERIHAAYKLRRVWATRNANNDSSQGVGEKKCHPGCHWATDKTWSPKCFERRTLLRY